jgi:hypothetical protein
VIVRAALAFVVIALVACVSTREMMSDSVLQRAEQDLVCDQASTKIRQVGVISKYQGGRQGTIERATFSAEGCGGSEVYNVECVRGVCFANKDVPPKDKKTPSYYDDEQPGAAK